MKKYLIIFLASLTIYSLENFGIENFNPNFALDALKELEETEDAKLMPSSKITKPSRAAKAALLAQIWESSDQDFDGAAIAKAEVARIFKSLEKDNIIGVLNFETIVVPRLITKYQESLAQALAEEDYLKIIELQKNFNKFKEIVLNYKKQKLSDESPANISESVRKYVMQPKFSDMPSFLARYYLSDFAGHRKSSLKKDTKDSLAALDELFAQALA